ncbi:MAG: alpha/beta hydrolase [Acidobacteria bacterium]|nr:alpha/beta hydrolase [Acidobacteriota bacterium]
MSTCLALMFCLVLSASAQQAESAEKAERVGNIDTTIHEDWTTLSVGKLDLKALPPMMGGKYEAPTFTRELVRLQWRSGNPVDIFVVLPKRVSKPRVVLYLYSFPSDEARFRNDEWCKAATEGGFAAVGFLSALTGERYQGRAMTHWFVSELQESLGATTHDVQMILNYLEQRGDLTAGRVAMYGQGSGASIALLAASVDPRIAVLDLLDPWGDWPEWIQRSPLIPDEERAGFLRSAFLDKVAALDPVKVLPSLGDRTLRIQQVSADPITPKAAKDKIAAAIPPQGRLVTYDTPASLRKAWQEKGLWNWAKEQLRFSVVPPTSTVAAER